MQLMKSFVRDQFPGLYSQAWQLKHEYRIIRQVGLLRLLRVAAKSEPWQKVLPIQTPQKHVISDFNFNDAQEILDYLKSKRIQFAEGGHTIYLPPKSVEKTGFATLTQNYPPDAGLKIIKNVGGIDDTVYMNSDVSLRIQKKAVYHHYELSLVANLLHSEKIGPRLYDLVELDCGNNIWTAYVIQHVDGRDPSKEECESGLETIRELEEKELVKVNTPGGYDHVDFEPPTCRKNALIDKNSGEFQYLDFQNFYLVNYEDYLRELAFKAVEDSHFGDRFLFRRGQTVQF